MVKVIKKSNASTREGIQTKREATKGKPTRVRKQTARSYQKPVQTHQSNQGLSDSPPPSQSDQGQTKTVKAKAESKMVQLKGQKSKVRIREARRYQRDTKAKFKATKREYRKVKKLATRQPENVTAQERLTMTREELKEARLDYRSGKRVQRQTVKDTRGGSATGDMLRRAKHVARNQSEQLLEDNDTLDDLAHHRQKIRQVKNDVETAKRLTKYTLNTTKTVTKGATKATYSVGNRTYNLARGRGFTRTAVNNRWEVKLQKRLKQMRMRLARTRAGRAIHQTKNVIHIAGKPIRFVIKPLAHLLVNPLSISSYLLLFLILLVMSVFISIPSTIEQDEFDLNDAWLLMTKLDREKSTESVDYWTNIDDVLFYMNFRYGGFTIKDRWPEKPMTPMSGALKDIWNQLNKDENNLKTMADLYQDKKSWLKLSKEDLSDYKEALELADEVGRYVAYQDLDNPLYPPDDETNYNSPIVITDRFGYIDKKTIKTSTTIKATQGQDVRAAMSGNLTIKDDKVIITSGDSRLTYHHIDGKRHQSGDEVEISDLIGQNSSGNGLELTYEKKDDKGKWVPVNIGFYLEKVAYNQTTSVLSDINFSGGASDKFSKIYARIKKKKPKATINGVSAMLGNFETESGTNPKRAESDYVAPPVGASGPGSWDDPAWLSIGEPQLYGGRFPNIKRRGLGLGQWTDTYDGSNRHTLLLEFAKKKGKKWYDLDLQIDFMLEGDNPYYINILDSILTSNEPVDVLTQRFLVEWEGNPGDKLLERQNNAKQIANLLKQPARTGKPGHLFDEPYKVIQPYGYTPWSTGAGYYLYAAKGGRHDGIDFVVNRAEYNSSVIYAHDIPVYSVTNGTVKSKYGDPKGGFAIVIRAEGGGTIYYGHLKYMAMPEIGSKVKQGQVIAYLGDTGSPGIPHVHFQYNAGDNSPLGHDDKDPSFLIPGKGNFIQNQVITP